VSPDDLYSLFSGIVAVFMVLLFMAMFAAVQRLEDRRANHGTDAPEEEATR